MWLLPFLACATPQGTPPVSTASPATAAAEAGAPIPFEGLTALDGSAFDPSVLAGRTVLVVNVASECGFTPQYDGLQALYAEKKDDGLVILGVPSNQFGGQEPGGAEDIATFCRINYGVEFPLLEKQDVKGPGQSPLYAALTQDGKDVRWNFEKFLVGPDGQLVGRWSSKTTPDDDELRAAIDAALAG